MSAADWPASRAALAATEPHQRETVRELALGLVDAGKGDGEVAAAVTRWTSPTPTSPPADLDAHRQGVAAVLHRAIALAWWTAPGDRDYPTISTECEMGQAAALLLAGGERPWRVVRSLARTWPEFRPLLLELVRAVIDDARRAA